MNKIRKGDQVIVLTGRDKGKRGAVTARVDADHVLVEGVNVVKKHVRPNPMHMVPPRCVCAHNICDSCRVDEGTKGWEKLLTGGCVFRKRPQLILANHLCCLTSLAPLLLPRREPSRLSSRRVTASLPALRAGAGIVSAGRGQGPRDAGWRTWTPSESRGSARAAP